MISQSICLRRINHLLNWALNANLASYFTGPQRDWAEVSLRKIASRYPLGKQTVVPAIDYSIYVWNV